VKQVAWIAVLLLLIAWVWQVVNPHDSDRNKLSNTKTNITNLQTPARRILGDLRKIS